MYYVSLYCIILYLYFLIENHRHLRIRLNHHQIHQCFHYRLFYQNVLLQNPTKNGQFNGNIYMWCIVTWPN